MNAKAWVPLAVAILLGGVAAKVGRDMMARKETTKTVTVNVSRVVVAKDNISPGTALRAEILVANPMAENALPPGSFRDVISLNNRVVTMPVIKGQPILENMLAPEGTSKGLTAIVPDGMRAVTLEVNEVSGVAGMLVPGCRIDIVSTVSNESGQLVARTIARNLQIVAVGHRFADVAKDVKDEAPEAAPARSVTLLASPHEAELIDLAAHTGAPRLILRGSRDSRTDSDTQGPAATLAELRGTPPEKSESFGQMFNRLLETIAKASQPPAKGLFTEAPAPKLAARPSDVRNVTVIRSTREQAVQLETGAEPRTPTLVETDRSDVINK